MAIDISSEQLVPLHKAAPFVPGNPHQSTFWRWGTRGVRGVVLETVVIGGRRYTSQQALERFFEAIDPDFGCFVPSGAKRIDPGTSLGEALLRTAGDYAIDALHFE